MTADSTLAVELFWHGPFTMRELLVEPTLKIRFRTPGVYLWLDHSTDPPSLSYVGRATGAPDLWTRQWQHYTFLIAGHYEIPDRARPGKGRWGMSYDEVTAKTLFDVESYIQLVRECHAHAEHQRVYLCPLDTTLVRAVERQLIYELQRGSASRGAATPPPRFLPLLHRNATWFSICARDGIRDSVRIHDESTVP